MKEIRQKVENDQVVCAYQRALIEENGTGISGLHAYSILISMNKLVFSALKNKTCCKSKPEDIFHLTMLCCNVESMWKQGQTECMQCVYHIMRYFLDQSSPVLARKLCEYFFKLQSRKNSISYKWEQKESLILSSIVFYTKCYLCDTSKNIEMFPTSMEKPPACWFQFLLSMNELNNYASTSDIFRCCYSLLRRSQDDGQDNFIEITKSILGTFADHLEKLSACSFQWTPKEDICPLFVKSLLEVISYLKENEHIYSLSEYILNFNQSMKKLTIKYSVKGLSSFDFEVLETVQVLCLSGTKIDIAGFDGFINLMQRKETISREVCSFIHVCFSIFCAKICNLLHKDNERVKVSLSILYDLYARTKHRKGSNVKTENNDLLHAFITAMHILISSKVDAEVHKEVYKTVRLYFKEFSILVLSTQKKKSVFDYGVNYCTSVIQSYKDLKLYHEAGTLCRDYMKYIMALDQDCLPVGTFGMKLERFFSFFIQCFMNLHLSVDAQIALFAFAKVHPQFSDIIFKFWAELKSLSTDFNFQKDSTVYDIITSQKEALEGKWSVHVLDDNVDKLLLEEIKAYSKYRDLHVNPVIAVYRAAVKSVKDKILLAEIVAAAIDSVSSDGYVSALNNLQLSLDNILGNLYKMKEGTQDNQKLFEINCAIGNLLYQQARCEIVAIRKKAEEEFELMDVPAKQRTDIPVVEGEESNITPAYMCLKIEQQTALAEKMFKCIDYWSQAAQYVNEDNHSMFSFRYLKGLAYLFRLYCYKDKEAEMWKLIYCISKKTSNKKYKVLAVAELLSISLFVDPSWIEDVKNVLEHNEVFRKKHYVYPLFFINYAKNFYFNQKFDEASKIVSHLDEAFIKRRFLVYAQYKILLYLLKKDNLVLSPNRPEATLYLVVSVFENILYQVKHNKWNTFSEKCILQWLLLDYSLILGKTYFDLKMIRHARSYAKRQLKAAQCLALPIRVCEFLILLCNTDLHTGHIIEANEKLSGLDMILELDHINVADSENSMEYFCETTLPKDVKKPKFLFHDLYCACFTCTSMEYLNVLLNAFALKGVYTSSAGSHDLAKHIFKIGEEIISVVDKKDTHHSTGMINCYTETKVKFYLSHSFAHGAREEVDKALYWNKTAMKTLEPVQLSNRLLMQEILCQMTTLKFCFLYKSPSVISYKPKLYANESLPVMDVVKTPETAIPLSKISKCLKSTVSTNKFKLPVSPVTSMARKAIFDDLESELEGKNGINDKENIESSGAKTSIGIDISPLALELPKSPRRVRQRNLFVEDLGIQRTPQAFSDHALTTPTPIPRTARSTRTATGRRAQTERKIKKPLEANLFATPFARSTKPEIKVFCDDDITESITKTAKTRTQKKTATTAKKSTVKKDKKISSLASGRKLTFDSDTEEESKKCTEGKLPKQCNEVDLKQVNENHFSDNDNELTGQKIANRDSWQIDESAIIEASYIDRRPENALILPLTPLSLEESMKQLSLSGNKKTVPLSSKKLTRLKTGNEQTPTTSLVRTRTRIINRKIIE